MKTSQHQSNQLESINFLDLISTLCLLETEEIASIEDLDSFLHARIFPGLAPLSAAMYFPAAPFEGFHALTIKPGLPSSILSKEPLFEDFHTHQQVRFFNADVDIPPFLAETDKVAHAFLPIYKNEDLQAILYLGSREREAFPESFIAGVQTLTQLIGSHLRRIDRISSSQQATTGNEASEYLQQALYDISTQAHLAVGEEELYRSLHRIIGRLLNARNFFIALSRQQDGEQYIKYVYYCDQFDAHMQGMEYKIDAGTKPSMAAYLLKTGQPVVLGPDVFDDFCHSKGIKPLGTKAYSLVGVPFYFDQFAGVVLVQSYDDVIYSNKDKDLLAYVARHIGAALSRKHAIDDMRKTNEIFSLFLRYSPEHIYIKEVKDGESRLLKASDAYGNLLNKTSAELIGKNMEEIFPAEFAAKTTADDWAVVRAGTPLQTEDLVDGRIFATTKFPIVQGEKTLLGGYSIDITERKRMEEALREKEQKYRIIFEKSPVAVISFDNEGTIVDFNDKFIEMMGSTREKLLGFNTARDSSPKMRETIKKALAGEIVAYEDTYTSITGGKTTFLRGLFSPVNPGEGPSEVIATLEDVTELKKHQREQQKIEKLESLGLLAGGIAHDFNNILTGILGNISFSRVLLVEDHPAHTPLDAAEKAARRAAELARQLLTFARGGEPKKNIASLPRLIGDSVSLMLRGSNVRAIVNAPESLHAVRVDEGQISQVLNNLIMNAAQAMPGGGCLTIDAANEFLPLNNPLGLASGTYIKLQVSDAGCGISPDNLVKIFDPYFSTKSSGTGLGLATAYSIIARHKGHIEVQSRLGQGTTFTLHLPSLGKSAQEFSAVADRTMARHHGGAILVMDDEELIRNIAAAMLSHLGYSVTSCKDGKEAVELYCNSLKRGKAFKAVILDLTIPGGIGGKEAAQHLLDLAPEAYLIVSSGYSNDPIMANYREFGFRGAIAKPYSIGEFEAIMQKITKGE